MSVSHWRSGLLPEALEEELDRYQSSFKRPTVVVVDDEPDFCELVATYLDDGGKDIVQRNDATGALATIGELRPSLAIIDIRLPEMDGFDLVARARKLSPDTVFLMMSAHTSVDLVLQAMRRDVHDYLPKPLPSAEDLNRTVRHALEKQRLQTVYTLQTLVGSLTLTLEGISSVGETRNHFFKQLVRGAAQISPGISLAVAFPEGPNTRCLIEGGQGLSREARQRLEVHASSMLQAGRGAGTSVPVLVPHDFSQELRASLFPTLVGIHIRSRRGAEAVLLLAAPRPNAVPRESVDLTVWFARSAGIVIERHQASLDLEYHMLVNQLDHLSDAVVVLDKTCSKVQYLNIEARALLGKVSQDPYVAAIEILPSLAGPGGEQMLRTRNALGPVRRESTIVVDGEERIFDVRIHPFDSPARVSYRMFVLHEITQIRREATKIQELNEELRVQNLHLEAMNKELDNFVYIASHDLQEPFRHIEIFAKYLEKDLARSPAMTEDTKFHLDQIGKNSDVACRILADLRTLSRITRLQNAQKRLSLGQILREVVERFASDVAKGELRIRVRSLPMMKCDPIKMKELFQNLISNAVKYNKSEKKEIEIGTETRTGEVLVYVKDNGVGVDPESLDYIFQPFKILPVKGIPRGSGLGLYIAKKVVEEHGGRIWVESVQGVGSTFFMAFPGVFRSQRTTSSR